MLDNLKSTLSEHMDQHGRDMEVMENFIDRVQFGLVANGGFVRGVTLTRQQRETMDAQENANLVLYNMRLREPEETDRTPGGAPTALEYNGSPNAEAGPSGHGGVAPTLPLADDGSDLVEMEVEYENEEEYEEEGHTADPVVAPTVESSAAENATAAENPLSRLLTNLREMQNEALTSERFADAAEIQKPILTVLDNVDRGREVTMEVATATRNSMQRLHRAARNRGEQWLANVYRAYVDDFRLLLQ